MSEVNRNSEVFQIGYVFSALAAAKQRSSAELDEMRTGESLLRCTDLDTDLGHFYSGSRLEKASGSCPARNPAYGYAGHLVLYAS